MTHFDQLLLIIYWRWIGNSLCWNSSLKVIHLTWGQCFDHHGMLYIISNLPKVAIWRSKDFRIRPLMAEKSTTLLFRGTFGHTVAVHMGSPNLFPLRHPIWFSGCLCKTSYPISFPLHLFTSHHQCTCRGRSWHSTWTRWPGCLSGADRTGKTTPRTRSIFDVLWWI